MPHKLESKKKKKNVHVIWRTEAMNEPDAEE